LAIKISAQKFFVLEPELWGFEKQRVENNIFLSFYWILGVFMGQEEIYQQTNY